MKPKTTMVATEVSHPRALATALRALLEESTGAIHELWVDCRRERCFEEVIEWSSREYFSAKECDLK